MKIVEDEEFDLENIYDDSQGVYNDPFFKEYDELLEQIFDEGKCVSLDAVSLDEERDEFYEAWGEVSEEISAAHDEWCDFVDRYNILNNVYSNFIKFSNAEDGDEQDGGQQT